jgi:hypothetical protein
MTIAAAERAAQLVGTPFRPQGRSTASGLDCLGVILTVHRIGSGEAPSDYRLRGDYAEVFLKMSQRWFRKLPMRLGKPGDVVAMKIAEDQLHLGILTVNGFVHAHARLGRVVETPGRPPWPILATLRRRNRARKAAR